MEVMTSWERNGMEKGIENGVEREKQAIALNMMRKSFSLEEISELTGLTIAQIQHLQIQSAVT